MKILVSKEEAQKKIAELVERYRKYEAEGKAAAMNEANTKAYFIEPLFEALGWDTRNPEEVSREEKVLRKRADYAFSIAGVIKFYVEAKAAGVKLEEKEAWQAINYAYNTSVPWAVLTNFKELVLYGADVKGGRSEDSRFLTFSFEEYISRFEQLWNLNKQSLLEGKLDAYAQSVGKKQKRAPVTKALFADFRKWFSLISKNAASHSRMNKMEKEELDEAVQKLLNRFVFIRTCEDRGLEGELLRQAVREWKSENKRRLGRYVGDVIDQFNLTYDSGLFAPHSSGDMVLDDAVLEQVINELYENSEGARYEFANINADVLGSIYEQYLSAIMKEGGGLYSKEGKRKEMGIYYTPTYIVDYIVKNTLGEKIASAKNHAELEKLKVLDPACGSGSFLIRAFGSLYGAYKEKNNGDQQMLGENGTVTRNTYAVLSKNLYGVDLDRKAVDISELNLLIQAAHKRGLLPPLNVKHGNSLISGTPEEMEKYFGKLWKEMKHPFNWEEKFLEVFEQGGFDVVIGNPPYERTLHLENDKEYYADHFRSAYGSYDICILFIEKAIKLLKEGGMLGFIVSNKFLVSDYGREIRRILLESGRIIKIVDLADAKRIFPDALVSTVIVIYQKGKIDKKYSVKKFVADEATVDLEKIEYDEVSIDDIVLDNGTFNIRCEKNKLKIHNKFSKLERFASLNIRTGVMGFEYWKMADYIHDGKKYKNDIRIATNSYIERYTTLWGKKARLYKKEFTEPYANLESMPVTDQTKELFKTTKKILVRGVAQRLTAALDKEGVGLLVAVHAVVPNKDYLPETILCLLNSKLFDWIHKERFYLGRIPEGSLKYPVAFLKELPLPGREKLGDAEQKEFVKLSERMEGYVKELLEMGDKQTRERQELEEEIKRTDAQIDALVYKLYGITEEERKVIEQSLGA